MDIQTIADCVANVEGSVSGYANQGCRCSKCRVAYRQWRKKRYEENPDLQMRTRARTRLWWENNKERAIKQRKEYYQANPEKMKSDRLARYGIDLEAYGELLASQNNRCAICRTVADSLNRMLSVDHNHTTGLVRGLLCNNCNTALGLLKENSKTMTAMLNYVMKENL